MHTLAEAKLCRCIAGRTANKTSPKTFKMCPLLFCKTADDANLMT